VVALAIPPSTKACNYKKIKAYGSHFRVDDQTSVGCVTYDSGVASFFSHDNVDDNHHPSRQTTICRCLEGYFATRLRNNVHHPHCLVPM